MNVIQVPAHKNNYGIGRDGNKVEVIVLHWMAGTLASCDATFKDPNRGASAHYGIGNNEVHQYVDETNTAWHCGVLSWNKKSIGIEHQGSPTLPISEETIQTSIKLVYDICKRYGISPDKEHIKRHSEFKSTECPGALPVERIIKSVSDMFKPVPQQNVYTPQTKIPLGDKYGEMEIQAIVSTLNDLNNNLNGETTQVDFLTKELNKKRDQYNTLFSNYEDHAKAVTQLNDKMMSIRVIVNGKGFVWTKLNKIKALL